MRSLRISCTTEGALMLKYLVLVLFLPACTAGRASGENCTTVRRGQFPSLTTPDSISWTMVDFREIGNHCDRGKFTYSGSFKDYHLIFWENSDSEYGNAEHRFAILKGSFTPFKAFDYAASGKGENNGTAERIFK